jgi:hypothetical protein
MEKEFEQFLSEPWYRLAKLVRIRRKSVYIFVRITGKEMNNKNLN